MRSVSFPRTFADSSQQVPNPPPQPSLAFPLTQPPPALSQHSWPHAQLSHLQPGPASSPDQSGLEAETIKQSLVLPLHRVRPPPPPSTSHPDILTARSPRMLVHLLTTGFLSCLGWGVTAGHPVRDQGSWLPYSVEIDQMPDKKFRQGFTGLLLQQEERGKKHHLLLLACSPRGSNLSLYGGG